MSAPLPSTSTAAAATRIILITGANRGIGLAILRSLIIALPNSSTEKTVFLLGCRDLAKGHAAIAELQSEDGDFGTTSGASDNMDIYPIQLDVTNNESVLAAVVHLKEEFGGKLDVLINNAGFAIVPPADAASSPEAYRRAFADVFDVNVTSVALCTALFLPLLRLSQDGGRVINISSGRASMQRLTGGNLPTAVSLPYGVSKVALNALTVEMARAEGDGGVMFQCVNPGHCRTAFNGYRGLRDPMEGAIVVAECVIRRKDELENAGFWETMGDRRELVKVPW